MFYIVFYVGYFAVCYLNVSFSGLITTVGEERADFSAIDLLLVILWFLFGEVSFPKHFVGCSVRMIIL